MLLALCWQRPTVARLPPPPYATAIDTALLTFDAFTPSRVRCAPSSSTTPRFRCPPCRCCQFNALCYASPAAGAPHMLIAFATRVHLSPYRYARLLSAICAARRCAEKRAAVSISTFITCRSPPRLPDLLDIYDFRYVVCSLSRHRIRAIAEVIRCFQALLPLLQRATPPATALSRLLRCCCCWQFVMPPRRYTLHGC